MAALDDYFGTMMMATNPFGAGTSTAGTTTAVRPPSTTQVKAPLTQDQTMSAPAWQTMTQGTGGLYQPKPTDIAPSNGFAAPITQVDPTPTRDAGAGTTQAGFGTGPGTTPPEGEQPPAPAIDGYGWGWDENKGWYQYPLEGSVNPFPQNPGAMNSLLFNQQLMSWMMNQGLNSPKYGGNLQIGSPYLQEAWGQNQAASNWLQGYGSEAWNEAYNQRNQFGNIPGQIAPMLQEAWQSSRNISGQTQGIQNRGIGYLDALFPGVQQMSATGGGPQIVQALNDIRTRGMGDIQRLLAQQKEQYGQQ